ncbi:alpha-L-fucosidase [Agriterribacter sp.]|uniref:alpha-L-fucosidase n=1 Tax=Agriterribacter sp. TaxID=2821509 RepID=UPI002BC647A3|nr:alpha-L-fucosidase [Agriterribacter sp.]HRO45746.1 alpha-L-fucosidase [Agriterribacter sp.]HRQ15776.1 alpha-L-fucosidase [Agriterribacter sp.]
MINYIKRYLLLVTCFVNSLWLFGQSVPDVLFFKDKLQPITEDNIFKTDGYYHSGSSIIKGNDGKYHLFYSRWKKEYSFSGWIVFSEIAHAIADRAEGPWEYKETVLQGGGKEQWDSVMTHNPKIKFFDGKYYLYYSSINYRDGTYTLSDLKKILQAGPSDPKWRILHNSQRISVAVANSPNGPWKRADSPIGISGSTTTLKISSDIIQKEDRGYCLIVEDVETDITDVPRNQLIAFSDSPVGPFELQKKPLTDFMRSDDISTWYDKKRKHYYAVFPSSSFIGMISSTDGIDWKKATEYVLMPKVIPYQHKDTLHPSQIERPFVYCEQDDPRVVSVTVQKDDESYIAFLPVRVDKLVLPNKRQLAWQEAEIGAIFHYELHIFDGQKYIQENIRINPVKDYQTFNPTKLDTDQWVKAAKDAGFTFALLTATHESGFALYQSDVNPYSMKALNFQNGKGDIVRDFVNSCRKYGIKPGIYLGIRWNSFFGVHDFKLNGEGEFRENRHKWYNRMVEGMVKEICTRYGSLFEIWFDGGADHPASGAPDVLPIVQQYQPDCIFYHNRQLAEVRWGGSESGTVNYPCWATFPFYAFGAGESFNPIVSKNNYEILKVGDPDGRYWMPAMSDAPLRGSNDGHDWFWDPGCESHVSSLDKLMDMYYKSVGRNSTLIMGLTPDADGLLPEPDVKRLQEWGNEIRRRFSNPLAKTSGKGNRITLQLYGTKKINHIIIQEDIRQGERIREYRVEAFIKNKWKTICDGQSIGHKRIQQFEPTECTKIRLVVVKATAEPIIKSFSVFWVD